MHRGSFFYRVRDSSRVGSSGRLHSVARPRLGSCQLTRLQHRHLATSPAARTVTCTLATRSAVDIQCPSSSTTPRARSTTMASPTRYVLHHSAYARTRLTMLLQQLHQRFYLLHFVPRRRPHSHRVLPRSRHARPLEPRRGQYGRLQRLGTSSQGALCPPARQQATTQDLYLSTLGNGPIQRCRRRGGTQGRSPLRSNTPPSVR